MSANRAEAGGGGGAGRGDAADVRTHARSTSDAGGARAPARSEISRLLSEMAPHLMTPSMVNALTHASFQAGQLSAVRDPYTLQRAPLLLAPRFSMDRPARSLARIGGSLLRSSGVLHMARGEGAVGEPVTSAELRVLEDSQRILASARSDLDAAMDTSTLVGDGEEDAPVSLLRVYEATTPASQRGKQRRRKVRAAAKDAPPRALRAAEDGAPRRVTSGVDRRMLSLEELEHQDREIHSEIQDLAIRRTMYTNEIASVDTKIAALEAVRSSLEQKLLSVREEELELDDERQGLSQLLEMQRLRRQMPGGLGLDAAATEPAAVAQRSSSRRRRGPLFLPSEHDSLPPRTAFMTLGGHSSPITSLDFSEPYGTLVSSAVDDGVRVWDLSTGEDVGRLRGHRDTVKCLQVEDELCVTGSMDHALRLWDLRRVPEHERVLREGEQGGADGDAAAGAVAAVTAESDPCLRTLEGHSKGITALYFDDGCLVTGAMDKTMRQWDLETGQCVLTMDILWAISNPPATMPASPAQAAASPIADMRPNLFTGPFSYPMPPMQDGSWEVYQDFVGGIQFWGYALASGSGDGDVRLWDLRTGQAHRTLSGHTAPITCLQFDENCLVSGGLDKSIRVWDLRMGSVLETIRYEYPVTALQFDTRKILAAAGSNTVDIYNRTSHKHSALETQGHTAPAERLRYMDRYAVTGGKDSLIKVWSL